MTSIRERSVKGLKAGDSFTISRTFTERDMTRFADSSRDYNPVHFDKRFSLAKGFNGCICHGLLVGSMITEIGGQIGWLATEMHFKFKKPVYFGDTVTCTITINGIDEKNYAIAKAVFVNQENVIVLTCFIAGLLPNPQERGIIKEMMAEGDPTNRV